MSEQNSQATVEETTEDLTEQQDGLDVWDRILAEEGTTDDDSDDLTEDAEGEEAESEDAVEESADEEVTDEEPEGDTETDDESASESAEDDEFDFQSVFPHGLEVLNEGGESVQINSADELQQRLALTGAFSPEELKSLLEDEEATKRFKDLSNWEKSLHRRGYDLNQKEIEKQAEHATLMKELYELRRHKSEKAETDGLPPEPDSDLLNVDSESYNPAEYHNQFRARIRAEQEAATKKATAPPQARPVDSWKSKATAKENAWQESVKGTFTPDQIDAMKARAMEHLNATVKEERASDPNYLPDPALFTAALTLAQQEHERGHIETNAKNIQTKATESGARTVLRAVKRGAKATAKSKTEGRSDKRSNSDPVFDNSVSPAKHWQNAGIKGGL